MKPLLLLPLLAAAQQVPVADIPTMPGNKPYAPPETVQRVVTPVDPKEARLKVLIISGQNSYEHDWTGVNNQLRTMMKDTGRFDVRVTEDFDDGTLAMLKKYDVVLLNYASRWNYGDKEQHLWSPGAFKALYDYVAQGGGLVAFHSSFTWGRDIPEYKRLLGAVMVPGESRRSPPDGFRIKIESKTHPVTAGLRPYIWSFMEDKYTNMSFDPAAKVTVLATAFDDAADYVPEKAGPKYDYEAYKAANVAKMKGMNKPNPVVWTQDYGKGRVFSITLGHGPDTLQFDGVRTLVTRGAEWAATGKVTIPALDKATGFDIPEAYRTEK
ncbi:ThuA domain-containing protein [uncultured Sphingomonas sp.]|uniref:ThuA domain-containing protein n=1 Tax=uncultured Sphingomonas sp. TaxID=158754 RepID=UPI0025D6431F|nr:ThuA domain-containing protein [uncultured Sphingomonas sp.]